MNIQTRKLIWGIVLFLTSLKLMGTYTYFYTNILGGVANFLDYLFAIIFVISTLISLSHIGDSIDNH